MDYQEIKKRENLFWKKVNKTESCWLWTASKDRDGYGHFARNKRAHRISYILIKGKIPKGLWVLHKCDNPPCVNPDHLYLGTIKENTKDKNERGRYNPSYGEKSHFAKLTTKQVLEIRKLRASGKSLGEIAKIYKIGKMQVSRIYRKLRWSHI